MIHKTINVNEDDNDNVNSPSTE